VFCHAMVIIISDEFLPSNVKYPPEAHWSSASIHNTLALLAVQQSDP